MHRRIENMTSEKSSDLSRVMWIIKNIALGTTDVAIGLVLIVVVSSLKLYALWPLAVYGGALVAFRWLFLLACPVLHELTVPIVIIINALLVGFMIIVDAAIAAIDIIIEAVNGIVDIVNSLDKLFTGHKATNFQLHLVKFPKTPLITYTEFSNAIKTIPPTCKNFDSVFKIISFFMRYGLHEYTCPLVRVLWPLPSFYQAAEGLLSWTYYGSANPYPYGSESNCNADGQVTIYDSICAGLGVGYVFLEFFLPVIILFIVLSIIGKGVGRLLSATFYTIYISLEFVAISLSLFFDVVAF